jgi:hypothetical protein
MFIGRNRNHMIQTYIGVICVLSGAEVEGPLEKLGLSLLINGKILEILELH